MSTGIDDSRLSKHCDAHGDNAVINEDTSFQHSSDTDSDDTTDSSHTKMKPITVNTASNLSDKETIITGEDSEHSDTTRSNEVPPTVNDNSHHLDTKQAVGVNDEPKQNDEAVAAEYSQKLLSNSRQVFNNDKSGALHVYFLIVEGLSSTVSAGPKNYQPQTLEMLFELMRLASRVLGKFSTDLILLMFIIIIVNQQVIK